MNNHNRRKTPVTVLAISIGLALQLAAVANAQETQANATQSVTELDRVQVTGSYRASLEQSLDLKRESAEQIDTIVAEDIGKFPDQNLAESLQRIPGVAIDRAPITPHVLFAKFTEAGLIQD